MSVYCRWPENVEDRINKKRCTTRLCTWTCTVSHIHKWSAPSFRNRYWPLRRWYYYPYSWQKSESGRNKISSPGLQGSANKFDSWCIDHSVLVNYLKTFAMLLGSRYTTSTDEEISVSVNGHLIGSSHHTLTWEQQTNLLSKYVNQDSLKQ